MREAVEIAPYLIGHASAAFELLSGRRSPLQPARAVLRWITRKGYQEFAVRQAWRDLAGQAWCTDTDQVREAIDDLEELGWVRQKAQPEKRGRGRPSERYEVNPAAHASNSGVIRSVQPNPPASHSVDSADSVDTSRPSERGAT